MFQKKFLQYALCSAGFLGIAAVCAVSFFRDRPPRGDILEQSLFVMDTYCEISVQEGSAASVSQLLYDLDDALDSFDTDSDIAKLNCGKPLDRDSSAGDVIAKSLALQTQYGNSVDITSGALTKLWGITTENPRVPAPQELKAALETIGPDHVHISEEEITLDDGTQIDLGAAAKGYALDCAAELFAEQNVPYGKISMTSSMLLYGEKPDGKPFTVAIRDPAGKGTLGTVETGSCFLSTSGGYERFFTAEDGTKYSHILSTESGYPIETDLTTVTVFCDSGLLSDYLSTLIYMGGTAALETHLRAENYKIVAADTEGRLYVSDGLAFTPSEQENETEETE